MRERGREASKASQAFSTPPSLARVSRGYIMGVSGVYVIVHSPCHAEMEWSEEMERRNGRKGEREDEKPAKPASQAFSTPHFARSLVFQGVSYIMGVSGVYVIQVSASNPVVDVMQGTAVKESERTGRFEAFRLSSGWTRERSRAVVKEEERGGGGEREVWGERFPYDLHVICSQYIHMDIYIYIYS